MMLSRFIAAAQAELARVGDVPILVKCRYIDPGDPGFGDYMAEPKFTDHMAPLKGDGADGGTMLVIEEHT